MAIKIALVDDKAIVRSAIKDKLYSCGEITIVLEASNGEEFLEKLKELASDRLPQVVLMDLEMPEMNGIQTIALGSMLFEAIKAGASGYLLKDDDAVNLTDAILNVYNYNAVPMSPAIARKTLGMLKAGVSMTENAQHSNGLSNREQDVLRYLVEGLEYKQIAEKLFISPATVRTHTSNIYQKLHVNSKAQAINIVHKNKWL